MKSLEVQEFAQSGEKNADTGKGKSAKEQSVAQILALISSSDRDEQATRTRDRDGQRAGRQRIGQRDVLSFTVQDIHGVGSQCGRCQG